MGIAVHGQTLGDQRHAGTHVLGYKRNGGNIHDNAAHIAGELALWNDLAGALVDQHLLTALGILSLQSLDRSAFDVSNSCLELGNSLGLVVLNADDDSGQVHVLFHQLDTLDDVVGIFQHGTVVSCDVRLTLSAVYQQSGDLIQILGHQLDMGREAGTAQAHQPGSTDCRSKALKVSNLRNLDRFIDLLQFVGGDLHGLDGIARLWPMISSILVTLPETLEWIGRADKGVSIADDLTYFDQVGSASRWEYTPGPCAASSGSLPCRAQAS